MYKHEYLGLRIQHSEVGLYKGVSQYETKPNRPEDNKNSGYNNGKKNQGRMKYSINVKRQRVQKLSKSG